MNSQFSNSNFGRILYVAIISLIAAATIFVVWYMIAGYKLGTYEPDTRLGSVYIGGLTEDEVIPRLDSKIDYWYNDESIIFQLKYQGYTYEFDRNLFLFDLNTSMYDIEDGKINEILVYYQGVDRTVVESEIRELNFLDNIIDNLDIHRLINDVLFDAALMKSYTSKNMEDYIVDLSIAEEVIDTSNFSIPDGVEMDVLLDKITRVFEDGKIVIHSKELFDIVSVFGDVMNDAEMSVLSSVMLELVLDTDFLINEFHYVPTIDFSTYTVEDYIYSRRNTHVNQIVDESFSFYNPNVADYYFSVTDLTEFSGEMALSGLPFEYEIEVIFDTNELAYITQTTYDLPLLQNGHNGIVIHVTRNITNIDGENVYNKVILFEFYPPIKEIIYTP